jgi:hypothetical protein
MCLWLTTRRSCAGCCAQLQKVSTLNVVATGHNGVEAVQLAQEHPLHVITLDTRDTINTRKVRRLASCKHDRHAFAQLGLASGERTIVHLGCDPNIQKMLELVRKGIDLANVRAEKRNWQINTMRKAGAEKPTLTREQLFEMIEPHKDFVRDHTQFESKHGQLDHDDPCGWISRKIGNSRPVAVRPGTAA